MKDSTKGVIDMVCVAFSFIYMVVFIMVTSTTPAGISLPIFVKVYYAIPVFIVFCIAVFESGKRSAMFDAKAYVWRQNNHFDEKIDKLRNFAILSKTLANKDTEEIIEKFIEEHKDKEDADYR